MRFLLILALCAAASAWAQPAAKQPADGQGAAKQPADRQSDSASGGATAPSPSFRRDPNASRALFERLDKNRDGYLTGGELTSMEALTSNWITVDRDNDGRIARSEFTTIESGVVATQRP
jgi:hypothetical protein